MKKSNVDLTVFSGALILALAIWGMITYVGYKSGANQVGFPLSYIDRTHHLYKGGGPAVLIDIGIYFIVAAWIIRKIFNYLKK